jgi:hypothetical protein
MLSKLLDKGSPDVLSTEVVEKLASGKGLDAYQAARRPRNPTLLSRFAGPKKR